MATINLQDNHRIRSDSKQWIFEKRSSKANDKGEFSYIPLAYYASPEGVIKLACHHFVRKSDADGVNAGDNTGKVF